MVTSIYTLVVVALSLFGAGVVWHLPALRTAAIWVWASAFLIPCVPLLALLAVLLFQRLTCRKPPTPPSEHPGA